MRLQMQQDRRRTRNFCWESGVMNPGKKYLRTGNSGRLLTILRNPIDLPLSMT